MGYTRHYYGDEINRLYPLKEDLVKTKITNYKYNKTFFQTMWVGTSLVLLVLNSLWFIPGLMTGGMIFLVVLTTIIGSLLISIFTAHDNACSRMLLSSRYCQVVKSKTLKPVEGTTVKTPDGLVPIEKIKSGDSVRTVFGDDLLKDLKNM